MISLAGHDQEVMMREPWKVICFSIVACEGFIVDVNVTKVLANKMLAPPNNCCSASDWCPLLRIAEPNVTPFSEHTTTWNSGRFWNAISHTSYSYIVNSSPFQLVYKPNS